MTKLRVWPTFASSVISDERDNGDFNDFRGTQVRRILLEWECLKSH